MSQLRNNKTLKHLGVLLIAVLMFGVLTRHALAQADQGAITGFVTDPTGAVIPNAQVTLTNVDTALTLTTKTDSSGNYVFSPIKIGNYKVTVSAPGFSTTTQENIQVHVQDRVAVNVQLKAGETSTSVTVTD